MRQIERRTRSEVCICRPAIPGVLQSKISSAGLDRIMTDIVEQLSDFFNTLQSRVNHE